MPSLTTIASFPTTGGTEPDGELFIDSNGDLLGATVHGGANGIGTTYEIAKIGGGYATTPTFLADIPTDLNTLLGVPNLSADVNGDLFGLTLTGGGNGLGTIVEFPNAGGGPNTLANFSGGASGSHPGGRLLVDGAGNLFGTTLLGGANNAGTVFELQKVGNGYAAAPTILVSFSSGMVPSGSSNMIADAAGDLFGTTTSSVFEVQKTGASYTAPVLLVPAFPAGTQIGSLTLDAAGDIFGTTISGAANDDGSVFEIVKTGASYATSATTLVSFPASGLDGKLTLNHPKTLTLDANGDIFGTTDPSTQNTGGVVYEIVKTGNSYATTPTIVVNFNGGANGVGLGANLVADANGNLFGTTETGGGSGTAFEITGSGFVVLPVLTAGANANYVAGTTPVALDPGLSITGLPLTGATVSIAAGRLAGDTLTVGSPQGGITSSYNAGTGVLTLSGSASRAAYQAELDSVTFASASSLNPSSRTIAWSITDGANPPAQATSSVAVFISNSELNVPLQKTSGQLALWQANGVTLAASGMLNPNPGPSWLEMGTGTFFTGDASDILLQNTSGAVAVWQMPNYAFQSSSALANPGPHWRVEGTGDFNADGNTDVLLQKDSGDVSIWETNGSGQISQSGEVANPGPSWHVEGTGDFNQDNTSDIVLQNNNGSVSIWVMSGDQVSQSAVVANPGPSWHAVGTGDFYGDGKTDILLQNNSGSVAVWEVNGNGQITKSAAVANPGPTWHVVGTGDFNQDATTDIVLQNNSGAISVWDMNGAAISHSGVLANPGSTWSVVGDGRHIG